MASRSAHARALERIEAIALRPLESRALRGEILDVVADVVDFDGYVWLLTDPVTTVGGSPLADVPGLPLSELPRLIRAKYASKLNRWTELMLAAAPVGLMGSAGDVEPGGATEWIDLVGALGIQDVASSVFSDSFGCWGFLDLWRPGGGRPFTGSDAEFLVALAPSVTTALRVCQARTFVAPARPHRDDVGPVAFTLDDNLRIVSRTAASQAWLDLLLPPDPGTPTVPAGVYNVAAQLLATESGIDDHPASTRTHLSDGFWITLRAARMAAVQPPGQATERPDPGIVVTIEETSAVERLELFVRAFALTRREEQLVGLLAAGADTRAMARAMGVSMNTVQDHLKAIFVKTSTHDRVTLMSRALGTRSSSSP